MKKRVLFSILLVCLVCLSATAAMMGPQQFYALKDFPASNGFTVAGDTLGDGRFVLYDGANVLVETAVGSGHFGQVATGYPGDPAFIAVAPDGHTCLLGAGGSGALYLVDTDAPVDSGAAIASVGNNYSGVWISANKVVIEAADGVFPASVPKLKVLDVSGPTVKTVVNKEGASAFVGLSGDGQTVYSVSGYGANVGETVGFSVDSLIDAFDTDTPLEWSDGDVLGAFYSSGCAGGYGDVLAFVGYQGIQYVDELSGAELNTWLRNGSPFGSPASPSYSAVVNKITGRVLVIVTDWGPGYTYWPPEMTGYVSSGSGFGQFAELPVIGLAGLAVLGGLIVLAVRRRLRA